MWEPDPILEVLRAFEAIDTSDPERAHEEADTLLLAAVPDEVRKAYNRLMERCSWWAAA